MALILPGQEFDLEYGDGQTLRVKALAGKQQKELGVILQKAVAAEVGGSLVDSIDAAEEALKYIVGDEKAEQLWSESVDARMALEIARGVFGRGQLSEDEEKN